MPATESKKQVGVRGRKWRAPNCSGRAMRILERNWRCRLGESEMLSEDATVGRRRACQERQLATS